jgi:hypothetical protein
MVVRHLPLTLAVVLAVGNRSRLLDEEIRAGFSVTSNRDQWHGLFPILLHAHLASYCL